MIKHQIIYDFTVFLYFFKIIKCTNMPKLCIYIDKVKRNIKSIVTLKGFKYTNSRKIKKVENIFDFFKRNIYQFSLFNQSKIIVKIFFMLKF